MQKNPRRELEDERREYLAGRLVEQEMPENPLTLLKKWLDDARRTGHPDHTAMVLSTLERNGQPLSRVVLLKNMDNGVLTFYTNYHSRKARAMLTNPRIAANFFWPGMERQVKIAGMARQVNEKASDQYFSSRPRESQLSAWTSPQSQVVPHRDFLEEEFKKQEARFRDQKEIPRPPHWGGYAIHPNRIEFWQGGAHRLHDRLEYRKEGKHWALVRLAP